MVKKDRSLIWVEGETSLVYDSEKEPYFVKIFHNIHKQKELEFELKESLEELQKEKTRLDKVNKEYDNFVHAVAHDLTSPINNLQGLVGIASKSIDEHSPARKYLSLINVSAEIFKTRLEGLAMVGRAIEEGKDRILVSFQEEMADIKLLLSQQIEAINPVIIEDFSRAPTIEFSKKNIASILYNLFSNSLKYRSPKRQLEIKIKTEIDGQYVILYFSDNGLGIGKEQRNKVFGMYRRAHDHVEGKGIGLTLVKRIIENGGGSIQLESEEGKGSTFKVYFKK